MRMVLKCPHATLQLPSPFSTRSASNLLITASFGYLIPSSILSHFGDLNTMNVHPSLLPKHRGAAPIQWTLMNGDSKTGVTVQTLSKDKFDEGKILAQSKQVRGIVLQGVQQDDILINLALRTFHKEQTTQHLRLNWRKKELDC